METLTRLTIGITILIIIIAHIKIKKDLKEFEHP